LDEIPRTDCFVPRRLGSRRYSRLGGLRYVRIGR
jgi:hypothetical protein